MVRLCVQPSAGSDRERNRGGGAPGASQGPGVSPAAYAPEFIAVLRRGNDWNPGESGNMNMALVSGHLFFSAGGELWTLEDPAKQDGKAFATKYLQGGVNAGTPFRGDRLFRRGSRLFYAAVDGALVGVKIPLGPYAWGELPASERMTATTRAHQVASGGDVFVAKAWPDPDAGKVFKLTTGAYRREVDGPLTSMKMPTVDAPPPGTVYEHPRPIVSVLEDDSNHLHVTDDSGSSWRVAKDGSEAAQATERVEGRELLRTGGFSYQLTEHALFRVDLGQNRRTAILASERPAYYGYEKGYYFGASHVEGSSIFVSEWNEADPTNCKIFEARTDGTTRLLVAGQNDAVAIEADATFVYWVTHEGALFRIHR